MKIETQSLAANLESRIMDLSDVITIMSTKLVTKGGNNRFTSTDVSTLLTELQSFVMDIRNDATSLRKQIQKEKQQ